jgi:hypothetical protein
MVAEHGVRGHAARHEQEVDRALARGLAGSRRDEHAPLDPPDPTGPQVPAEMGIDGAALDADTARELVAGEDGMGQEEVERTLSSVTDNI